MTTDLSVIKTAIQNPSLIHSKLRQMYRQEIKYPLVERYFEQEYGSGIDVMGRDWDNLIILDALRYDIFEDIHGLNGDLGHVISQASTSLDFIQANFGGKQFNDTIYVTANGWIEKLDSDPFFLTKKAYNNFDNRYASYAPENVYDLAEDTLEQYPDKRFIVHFMQPHVPYLGPKAEELQDRVSQTENVTFKQISKVQDEKSNFSSGETIHNLQSAAERGYISDSELRDVYIENLEIVLEYVRKLKNQFDGKTVITADHGELLGETIGPFGDRLYGHPGEVATLELRKVPWMELEYQSRRDIQSEELIESEQVVDEQVENTLKALGYHS